MAERKSVVELPVPLHPATEVRSTLVCVSLQMLRAHGHLEAYMRTLPPARHAEIEALVPGAWRPVELAVTHYRTLDELPISAAEREKLGIEVGRRLKESLVATMARLTKKVGATPWVVLENIQKLNAHTWKGGGFAVFATGPKDALLEWHGQPCASSSHFVTGFTGFVGGLVELFSRRAYVKIVPRACTPDKLVCTISWA